MKVPFHNDLDEIFRSDRSIWIKVGACSLVASFVIATRFLEEFLGGNAVIPLTIPWVVGLLLITGFAGAICGIMLSLKDAITRRIEQGDSVNPLFRLYLGHGKMSLVVWFVSIIFFTGFVTVIGSSMGFF